MEKQPTLSNTLIIERIRKDDQKVIADIYNNAFHYCTSFVLKNNGRKDDAKDIFQDALIVLVKKAQQKDFQIKVNVKTYLYSIVRNLWLKKLNAKGKLSLVIDEPEKNYIPIEEDEIEEKQALEERHQSLYNAMKKLKEDCKRLLEYAVYQKLPSKEIAKLMDYSEDFVRQKKRRCIASLKKLTLQEHQVLTNT